MFVSHRYYNDSVLLLINCDLFLIVGRCDRYNHSEADTDCDTGDDSPVLFGTFSSMSPQYRKFQSNSTTDLSFGDGKVFLPHSMSYILC